jgi:hypothetical protein
MMYLEVQVLEGTLVSVEVAMTNKLYQVTNIYSLLLCKLWPESVSSATNGGSGATPAFTNSPEEDPQVWRLVDDSNPLGFHIDT